MTGRQVHVFIGDTIIGTTVLEAWDRSMGVAGGNFTPSESYMPEVHARMLEGVERPSMGLRIETLDGVELDFESAVIIDWAETAGEVHGRELNVYGVDAAAFFGPNPDED